MAQEIDEWLEEYDSLSEDVARSGYTLYQTNLQRWFRCLDTTPSFARTVLNLETYGDFKVWFSELQQRGSGRGLGLPADPRKSLGVRLGLFRDFMNGNQDAGIFGHQYLTSLRGPQQQIEEINQQLFQPFVRELRRTLVKEASAPTQVMPTAPASDRIVTLDHNSAAYAEALETLTVAIKGLNENNSHPNELDKERRVAELTAGKTLLSAREISIAAITVTAIAALRYLTTAFADTAVGRFMELALDALLKLFGI